MIHINIHRLCLRVTAACRLHTSVPCKQPYTPHDNPGVYRRLKAISQDEPDIRDTSKIGYEDFEELEQDFLKAGDMYDEVTRTMRHISRRQQFKITEKKHFRPPKEPNMLTWSEKEQIRYLHQSNPEKWSAEVLAESFPASPTIIKKILKNVWRPSCPERLKAHDLKVSQNWIAFHQGQLEIHDQSLRVHLLKFRDRKNGVKIISDEEAVRCVPDVILQKPKRTEFLSLITSFKPASDDDNKIVKCATEDNSQLPDQIPLPINSSRTRSSTIHYTLDQFREKLNEDLSKSSQTSAEDLAIITRRKNDSVEKNNSSSEMYVAPSECFKPDAFVGRTNKGNFKLVDPNNLPNRITIPKDRWRHGMVYRVEDCFYSDQGRFLYRVPGLKT